MPRVIVLAGPSGAGKSRLASRLGLPILRLDDFYKNGDDPSLPRITTGPNRGLVDWDHPDSWRRDAAVAALKQMCAGGVADVPVYDISLSSCTGHREQSLGNAEIFVAEGIFAQNIVEECRSAGILAGAYCVTQSPLVTFWRRLARDLKERRKPPLVLIKRGWALMRAQASVVADAEAKGCTVVTPQQGYAALHPHR